MACSKDCPSSAVGEKKHETSEDPIEITNNIRETDIFRDTPIRYLGYANEVGEAFRAQVHVNLVRVSYLVASSYVCADAYSKGKDASQSPDNRDRTINMYKAVVDTLVWQGLASVIIPGFTINRICFISGRLLCHSTRLPEYCKKWSVTAIGLGAVPFIIKPIDNLVDWMMESTLRRWSRTEPEMGEKIVHHQKDT